MLNNIFCDFYDDFVLSDSHFVRLFNSSCEVFKSFDLIFKKDISYFRMIMSYVLFYGTWHV
ncbi:hypothetical protein [Methanobrevibacter olleyae]|uniref:hypothetical protein n=1 Tax=Methanobrevibacter olleyae TaxID=294671 RepID=UPI00117C9EA6|nr:hypothetical protein [Methanobrevibacter olleyae]